MVTVVGILLIVGIAAAFILSLTIPSFWDDSDDPPPDLPPKAGRRVGITFVIVVLLFSAIFFLGNWYSQHASGAQAVPAEPTPVIRISRADATAITANFNDMCGNLTLGEWQAVFADFTPAFQHRVGDMAQIPHAIGGDFLGGNFQAADCEPESIPDDSSDVFATIIVSDDVNHALFRGSVSPDPSDSGIYIRNIRSFAYVRTDAGWKIDDIQMVQQIGNP